MSLNNEITLFKLLILSRELLAVTRHDAIGYKSVCLKTVATYFCKRPWQRAR